jgi:hypothetical protein
MKQTTTKRDIKLKNGITIPAGTSGELTYVKSTFASFKCSLGTFGMSLTNAGDKFTGFKNLPSMSKLAKKLEDDCCTCPTITGAIVEPDGEDQYGFPSHLRMLGYV